MRKVLKAFGLLALGAVLVGIVVGTLPPDTPQPCDDPAACEEANKIAYANAAQNAAKNKEQDRQWAIDVIAIRTLRSALHNPASLQVEQVLRMPDASLCITYRATNAFGALVRQQAVIAPKAGASTGDARFVQLWNRHCGGQVRCGYQLYQAGHLGAHAPCLAGPQRQNNNDPGRGGDQVETATRDGNASDIAHPSLNRLGEHGLPDLQRTRGFHKLHAPGVSVGMTIAPPGPVASPAGSAPVGIVNRATLRTQHGSRCRRNLGRTLGPSLTLSSAVRPQLRPVP